MGKALTDPLFVALAALLLLQVVGYLRARGRARARGGRVPDGWLRGGALGVTLLLWVAGTALGARWALQPLEDPYADFDGLQGSPDHVVVLTGGMWDAPQPALDLPRGSSANRVDRGVEVFLTSDAESLIITGGVARPGRELGDLSRLMGDRAERMGVPRERIVLEGRSRNTRQHPVEVVALERVGPEDGLAVVTMARHLPRSTREFRRHFTEVEPVPAEFQAPRGPVTGRWFLPSSGDLALTAGAVHEYVGQVWYALLAVSGRGS